MTASELISALLAAVAVEGDNEVMLSISDGPSRLSGIEVAPTGWTIYLRDDGTAERQVRSGA